MTDILDFLARSPSPYHAAESAAALLDAAGFRRQSIGEPLDGSAGGGYVVRGGAIVAWYVPHDPSPGFVVIGAHTDSPNLRLKPRPDTGSAGYAPARRRGVRRRAPQLVARPRPRPRRAACRVRDAAEVAARRRRSAAAARPAARDPPRPRRQRARGSCSTGRSTSRRCWGLGDPSDGAFAGFLAEELERRGRRRRRRGTSCSTTSPRPPSSASTASSSRRRGSTTSCSCWCGDRRARAQGDEPRSR